MPPEDQTAPEEIKVDEAAIKRKSVMDGAWAGMKSGLKWGGIGALGLSGVGAVAGLAIAKGVITSHWAVTLATLATGGATAVSLGPVGIALGLVTSALQVAVTVGLPIVAAGVVIGGIVGAINGYSSADEKVELAQRQAKRDARKAQAAVARNRQQQQAMDQQQVAFNQQSEQIQTGMGSQLGNFSPDSTPNALDNNSLAGNLAPQGGKIG